MQKSEVFLSHHLFGFDFFPVVVGIETDVEIEGEGEVEVEIKDKGGIKIKQKKPGNRPNRASRMSYVTRGELDNKATKNRRTLTSLSINLVCNLIPSGSCYSFPPRAAQNVPKMSRARADASRE